MSRPTLEVADIIRRTGNSFWEQQQSHLAWPHRKVLDAIVPVPHRGTGRSSRSVRQLRPSGHLVQLMPQPALPQVPGERARKMAGGAFC